ncbi:MAG: hypothetical protein EOO76_07095 [Novosphingobium sp.]|nr:MAG: hypothetical protein EOO76_07095 [Novosphingobium sp.]
MQALINLKRGDLPTLLEVFTLAVTTLDAVGAQEFSDLSLHVKGVARPGQSHDLMLSAGQMLICPAGQHVGRRAIPSMKHLMLSAQIRELLATWKWPIAKAARYFRCTQSALDQALTPWTGGEPSTGVARFEAQARSLLFVELLRMIRDVLPEDTPKWLAQERTHLGGKSIETIILQQEPFFVERILTWSLSSEGMGKALH